MDAVETIVAEVLRRLKTEGAEQKTLAPTSQSPAAAVLGIPAEMSARHVHLTVADMKALFGQEELPVSRMISQPGQYLSTMRVRLIGSKGIIDNVAVLGPLRSAAQVEISATDARMLGVAAPVRLSGDLADAGMVRVQAGENLICVHAAIVAKRHLHMLPSDAARYGVQNGQSVCVRVLGARPLILEDVPVRVTESSALALHIDTDEANAAGLGKDCRCEIIGKESINAAKVVNAPCSAPASVPCAAPLPVIPVFEGRLLTEENVRTLAKNKIMELRLQKRQLITPLARDTAKTLGIKITTEDGR
ncbi:MAG: phosphate propanoyltransferase [Clostridia bacterium]